MSQIKTKYITDNAVTNAKLAQMAGNTVKANLTGSTANASDASAVSTATASTVMTRDSNANTQVNNIVENMTSTATAAGTTTLTAASSFQQFFTGSTTQTCKLPNGTTLNNGHSFYIINQSTGAVTVQDNGSNSLIVVSPGSQVIVVLKDNSSSNGSWFVGSNGSQYQSLVANASGTNPSFQAVPLNQSAAVTGALGISNGGTGSTSASAARTALGLAIGTDVQAFDAQLSSLVRQNSQSAAYTTVLSDGGKHILHPSADTTARTFTIDSNANVAYPIGTALTFVNQNGAGVVTIAITSDTMRLAGAGTTGSRTLAANGIATALKITSTEWIISGTGLT